ncbi:hypothetical protein FRC03_010711 [Tulasnella sp. 419]|nr:hypothetical protein FRC03_010711 [Tulasnella sp. 419]
MFKRVTKRAEKRKRHELEDDIEMGADRVIDSDSSDSESESSDSITSSESDESIPEVSQKSKRITSPLGSASEEEDIEDLMDTNDMDATDSLDGPPVSMAEVTKNPIYEVSYGIDRLRCVLCPSRKLRDDDTVSDHLDSKAHKRRIHKFESFRSSNSLGDIDDPREVIRLMDLQQQQQSGPDPREQNDKQAKITRTEKWKAIKARREALRARRRARRADRQAKIVERSDLPTARLEEPSTHRKKRRKVEHDALNEASAKKQHRGEESPKPKKHKPSTSLDSKSKPRTSSVKERKKK